MTGVETWIFGVGLVVSILFVIVVVGAILTGIVWLIDWTVEGRKRLKVLEEQKQAYVALLDETKAKNTELRKEIARLTNVEYRDDPAERLASPKIQVIGATVTIDGRPARDPALRVEDVSVRWVHSDGRNTSRCTNCRGKMIAIDVDTGEQIKSYRERGEWPMRSGCKYGDEKYDNRRMDEIDAFRRRGVSTMDDEEEAFAIERRRALRDLEKRHQRQRRVEP